MLNISNGFPDPGLFPRLSKLLWQVMFIFSCLCCVSNCMAQTKQIRIACIGNSITAGARLTDPGTESYPSVLSSMLSANGFAGYQVNNFGIGGATILKFGTPNLWRILDSLKKYIPDIVVIKAGTNETVGEPRRNWEHINEFEKDYSEYVSSIRKINPACRIIICSPLDMVIATEGLSSERQTDLLGRRPRIWELRKRIKKIAKDEHLYFLDLTKPFKGKANLMTAADGVHPNREGYNYLANLVFDFMLKKQIIIK